MSSQFNHKYFQPFAEIEVTESSAHNQRDRKTTAIQKYLMAQDTFENVLDDDGSMADKRMQGSMQVNVLEQ